MSKWHLRSNRKPTGAKLTRLMKKKRRQIGTLFIETQIANKRIKTDRSFGGNKKIRLVSIDTANISDKGMVKKVKILSVTENPANAQYVRRNIITKGCVIKTEIGLARVTSRPSQDGIVNAVLIEKK